MTKNPLIICVLLAVFSTQVHAAATIVIQNNDGSGEGFNDPTSAATIPAQKGNNPGTTLGALRLNVFKEAARVLGAAISSDVTITVRSAFDPLPCSANSGTLGQAGATASAANTAGTAPNTAYGIALAESLAKKNLNGTTAEISATFNSDVDAKDDCLGDGGFYYGLDGNAPAGTTALFPVVVHEIAHGLGFSSMADTKPSGSGAFIGAGGFPDSFSRNLHDQSTGKSWDQMSNAERKASALNEPKLVWKGTQVTADRGMHLGPAPEFLINAPGSIAGTFPTVLGEEPSIVIPAGGVTGGVLDGNTLMELGGGSADGCSQFDFGQPIAGKIVLIDKSPDCSAAFPPFFLEFEGALAVIIVATTAGGLPDVSGQISNQEITIPYVGVTKAVGNALRANLGAANVTIRNSATNLLGTRAGRVTMHGPAVFEPGSSVSHWSTSASPNLLMEPAVNRDLIYKNLDLTVAALQDSGWAVGAGTPAAPAKPTGIKATDGTFPDRVRVTFNTVAGATVYRVFRCLTIGQTCGLPIGFPKAGTFDDKNGVPGTVYFYRVRACNPTTCGLFSAANTGFSSTAPAAPAKPTNVRATDGTFTDRVRITFNTVAGAVVYRVFRCVTAGQTCGSPIGFPKTGTIDDFKGVPGTVYFYRVRACNSTTCGLFSAANTGFSSVAPAKPTNVRATDGSFAARVRITWNKVTGATVYRVFRCQTAGQTCGSPIKFTKNLVFDDKKGLSGVVYFYRVRACIGGTCGKFSAANTGHRGTITSTEANVINAAAPVRAAVPIPALADPFSRWMLILLILGFGLLLTRHRYKRSPD